jgi:hypothetical protein
MDFKYYEEENKMLRELMLNWKKMYENLFASYESLLKEYDALVMETIKKDMEGINEK